MPHRHREWYRSWWVRGPVVALFVGFAGLPALDPWTWITRPVPARIAVGALIAVVALLACGLVVTGVLALAQQPRPLTEVLLSFPLILDRVGGDRASPGSPATTRARRRSSPRSGRTAPRSRWPPSGARSRSGTRGSPAPSSRAPRRRGASAPGRPTAPRPRPPASAGCAPPSAARPGRSPSRSRWSRRRRRPPPRRSSSAARAVCSPASRTRASCSRRSTSATWTRAGRGSTSAARTPRPSCAARTGAPRARSRGSAGRRPSPASSSAWTRSRTGAGSRARAGSPRYARAAAGRAVDAEPPVERRDAVGEPAQTGAAVRARARRRRRRPPRRGRRAPRSAPP